MSEHPIQVTVNGQRIAARVEARRTLGDFLRIDAGFTGTHLGCEHGVCGACTVIVDGAAVRACLMLAVQADGAAVTTVEGLAAPDGTLHPVQQAMRDNHGLQCGFCTPGIVCTMAAISADGAQPTEDEYIAAMSGHICRCTGYQGIRRAIRQLTGQAATHLHDDHAGGDPTDPAHGDSSAGDRAEHRQGQVRSQSRSQSQGQSQSQSQGQTQGEPA